MGSGTRVSRIPRNELRKYVLVIVETREEALRIEARLVTTEHLSDPLCLNLSPGGSMRNSDRGDQFRRKMRESWSHKVGVPLTEETKLKMRINRNRSWPRLTREQAQKNGASGWTPERRAAVADMNRRRSKERKKAQPND